jgi:hypothetical protein
MVEAEVAVKTRSIGGVVAILEDCKVVNGD